LAVKAGVPVIPALAISFFAIASVPSNKGPGCWMQLGFEAGA
jgi:hypothetical protein